MGIFTEDPIETQERWNEVLATCGCCGMPEHPLVGIESQDISAYAEIAWLDYDPGPGYTLRRRYDWSDGGFDQLEETAPYKLWINGAVYESSNVVFTTGDPKLGALTGPVYSDPLDVDTARAAARARILAEKDWDTLGLATGIWPEVLNLNWIPSPPLPFTFFNDHVLTMRFRRFRFIVPNTHPGNYYRVQWDYVDYPQFPDTITDPVLSSTALEWEWTGPGDPGDPDTWKSPWFEIPIPTTSLIRRLVNARYQSYEGGPFGVLPSFIGPKFP
jgi:hypothetical protein